MSSMRNRLLAAQASKAANHDAGLLQSLGQAASLAAAIAKLESTEDQLRQAQATLIAERVARTQIEVERSKSEENVKEARDELARAIRALHRARDEGKRTDEEKKRIARCFEETKNQGADPNPTESGRLTV